MNALTLNRESTVYLACKDTGLDCVSLKQALVLFPDLMLIKHVDYNQWFNYNNYYQFLIMDKPFNDLAILKIKIKQPLFKNFKNKILKFAGKH